ncbi:DUF4405 domain-containing protein [Thermodesulfobacteriota bacterium]
MNMRKITALTAVVSFIVLILNSIILYIVPQGRVAYWADWHMWGLTKEEWGAQHIIIGVLFLIAIFLHIYYNWKPMVSYLKNKARQLKVFTLEFNIALIITIVCTIGAYFTLPPFNWILDLSTSIKDAAGVKYGEPPYGHAELSSLKTLSRRMGLDLTQSIEGLKKSGIKFANEKQTLKAIAGLNNMTPQQVYKAMAPRETVVSAEGAKKLPDKPIAGTGKRSVSAICKKYNLDIKTIMRGFVVHAIKATADMSLKTIAAQNGLDPVEVYDIIKQIAESKPMPPQKAVSKAESNIVEPKRGVPTGIGRMTLAEVCTKYNLDQSDALHKLSEKGIIAKPDDKLRRLAEQNKLNPIDLYEIMK